MLGLPVHHAPERSSFWALRLQIAVARPLSRHAAHPPSVAAIRYILPAPRTRSVVATFRGWRVAAQSAFLCGSRACSPSSNRAVVRAISVTQPMHRPPARIASHRPWPWLALAVCARRAAWSARSRLQIALACALSGARWPIRTAQWSSGVPSTGPLTCPRASDRPWPQLAAARACPSRARCSASLVAARCCAGGATGGRLATVKTAEMDPQHPNCLTSTQGEVCVPQRTYFAPSAYGATRNACKTQKVQNLGNCYA